MKWGQFIQDNTLWKWRENYISYHVLKHIVKTLSTTHDDKAHERTKLLAKFKAIIAADLEKVASCFDAQQALLCRQYSAWCAHWQNYIRDRDSADKKHIQYCLMDALQNTLLSYFQELQTYAHVNAEGFRKIVKKYDKRLASDTQTVYKYGIEFRKKQFYEHVSLTTSLAEIEQLIQKHGRKLMVGTLANYDDDIVDNETLMNDFLSHVEHKQLLKQTAFPIAQNAKIVQIFSHCVRCNKYDAVQAMIEHFKGYDLIHQSRILSTVINARGYLDNTPLMTCSAVSGSVKMAILLLDNGANLSLQNAYFRNALHIAAQKGHRELVALLLQTVQTCTDKTDMFRMIRELDRDMQTPFHVACVCKQYAICKLLIEFDASLVTLKNADGVSSLMMLCGDLTHNGYADADDVVDAASGCESDDSVLVQKQAVLDFVVQHTHDINERDWRLRSALHYAAEHGNLQSVDALLAHNADAFVFDDRGQSPMHVAAAHGCVDILRRLCQRCSVKQVYNNSDFQGRTALHLAAGNGHSRCAQYLLSIGADASITDCFSCNAHSYAVYCGVWNDACPMQQQQQLSGSGAGSSAGAINDEHAAAQLGDDLLPEETPQPHLSHSASLTGLASYATNDRVSFMQSAASASNGDTNRSPSPTKPNTKTKTPNSKVKVKFRIQCATNRSQHVRIIGDCHELGNWDMRKGKRMRRTHQTVSRSHSDDEDDVDEHDEQKLHTVSVERHDTTTWMCEAWLTRDQRIEYQYIVCTYSSLLNWESLPTQRNAVVHDSMIIDDGVYGHQSDDVNYVDSGWLSQSDAQLQLRLGHLTGQQKRAPLRVKHNFYIDHIVVRSGYISANQYHGICLTIQLPIDERDVMKVYKFQASVQQMDALCSLQFEFFPRFSKTAIAKCFVLPSQILCADTGARTLALLSSNGLLIGEFNFEYTLIKPFKHAKIGCVLNKTFQHRAEYNTSILIGHRGTGSHNSAQLPGPRRTHIKENTILAFATAKSFGADYVEFDVQLTKDHVPVIYHDFLFPVHPFQVPINKITFAQLRSFNQKPRLNNAPKRSLSPVSRTSSVSSSSDCSHDDSVGDEAKQNGVLAMNGQTQNKACTPPPAKSKSKTKLTVDVDRSLTFLDDKICSLSDVFKCAPSKLGLNIEVKYPHLNERIDKGVENTVDINEYCDRILEVVFNHCSSNDQNQSGANRFIIFSSFHPDICKCLALKQPQFPVLFLTESGKKKNYNMNLNSLENALEFAKLHHLFGVVTDVIAVLQAPQLIDIVHQYGLVLLTYGVRNNDTANVDLQLKYGIDGVISDHVQHIRSHLDSKMNSIDDAL